MDIFSQLQPRQITALEALMRGASFQEAANEAGVSPRTLFNWRRTEIFQQALRQVQGQLFQDACGDLKADSRVAATTLRQIAVDNAAPRSARIRASATILQMARKLSATVDFDERLDRLEQKLETRLDPTRAPSTALKRLERLEASASSLNPEEPEPAEPDLERSFEIMKVLRESLGRDRLIALLERPADGHHQPIEDAAELLSALGLD